MVRGGTKRTGSRETASESPTQARAASEKSESGSSRRIRAQSPTQRKNARGKPLRRRRSRRNANPMLDDQGSHDDNFSSYSELPVPKNWTTISGKFNPNRSELGFDAKSNIAINVNSRYGCEESFKSGLSKSSDSNTSGDTNSKMNNKGKGKKKKCSDEESLSEEVVDPVERHRFHKLLKKAGIKKTFTFDQDWENNSSSSEVSELSIGNASYILDLAQQKETRKKDREEEALEEALDLYGTWLTEGKSDDKNIFLLILHEVKKEQKAKYKKSDKRHSALLDAALDEELKRREKLKEQKLKEEEEKEKAKAERDKKETEIIEMQEELHPANPSLRSSRSKKSRNHFNQSQSKISEIIEHETSQRNIFQRNIHNEEIEEVEESKSKDSSELSDAAKETIDVAERCTGLGPDGSRPSSSRSSKIGKKSGFFSCMSVSLQDVMSPSNHRRKDDSHNESPPIQPVKEDSSRMFSRLRRTLSERQAEQWKEEEKSWKKNNHVETKEEQWWKKINDAKRENELFDQQLMDLTTRSSQISTGGVDESESSTRTDRGIESGDGVITKGTLSTVEEKKKVASSKKKKSSEASDLDKTGATKEKRKKKKKKKNEKKSNDPQDLSLLPGDFHELKSPKKNKKKNSEEKERLDGNPQSIMKKADKLTNDDSKSGRSIAFVEEASVRSGRSTRGKKKKKKVSSVENQTVVDKKKKKVNSGEESSKEKVTKKKKKKIASSIGSSSDDAVVGDTSSVDWTHRCIMKTRSETTNGAETVLTMETAVQ